jgi:hypothetical protein
MRSVWNCGPQVIPRRVALSMTMPRVVSERLEEQPFRPCQANWFVALLHKLFV